MKIKLIHAFLLLLFCQCNIAQPPTKKELLNKTVVEDSVYKKDSTELLLIVKERLKNHESSFYSREYYDSTEITLDTLLYNEQKNKIAFFVVTKNPTARQLESNGQHDFYYDAFCYIGKKDDTTHQWEVKWFKVFNFINYYDMKETKERIRVRYFNELASVRDSAGSQFYKYNLNDKRFWEGPAWQKYFD